MAIGKKQAVGEQVGLRAAGALIGSERRLQALRNARVRYATNTGDLSVTAARKAAAAGIRSSRSALQRAVSDATVRGETIGREAIRYAKGVLAPAKDELRRAGNGMSRVARQQTRALRGVVDANPFLNPMNGNVPFTEAQRASAASGGRWARPWKVAADYRGGQLKPQLQSVMRDFGARMESAANRYINAEGGLQSARAAAREGFARAGQLRDAGLRAAREAFQPAVDFAVREGRASVAAAEAARTAAIARAGTMPGLSGKILAAGDAVRGVGSRVAEAVHRPVSYLSRSVNGRGLGTAIADSKLVRWNPIRIASKPISGVFNKIEGAGARVFSTSTGLGKLGRALTSAKGNAAAFAVGSWVEAGLNAYDFFKDKDSVDYVKQNGVLKSVGEAATSKKYWAEVGKGVGRALTLGFWGGGDDTALDRWAGNTLDGEAERNRQMNQLMLLGRDPVTGKVDEGALAREKAFDEAQKSIAYDKKIRTLSGAGDEIRKHGFLKYYSTLVETRDTALERAKLIADNWDNGGSQQARFHGTADQYLAASTAGLNKKYDAYFAAAMQNPEAKKVMEANRAAAYGMFFSGRDYAKDYELTGRDPNAVKGFAQFNERWGQLSDQQKVLWDAAAEKKVYEDARRAKAAEMQANASKEAENGGAE